MPHPQFVNPVPEVVGFRTAQFISEFLQPLDPDKTLVLDLAALLIQLFQQRSRSVVIREEYRFSLGHHCLH